MTNSASAHMGFLEWAVTFRAHPLESLCGDAYLIKEIGRGMLVGVIDGLGHGAEAAEASEAAILEIAQHLEDTPEEILGHCHQALRNTRGAVVSLAVLDTGCNKLHWIGVGNVEGMLLRQNGKHDWLPLRSGIVGCRMPSLRTTEVSILPGDVLFMFSDGILSRFVDQTFGDERPMDMAERIMSSHARGNDDAVILVAHYHGIRTSGHS